METAHSQRELDRLGRQILSLSTENKTALQTLRHFERTFDAVALNPVLAEFAWTVLNKTDLPMSERVERAIAYTNAGARLGREFWVDAAAELASTHSLLPLVLMKLGQLLPDEVMVEHVLLSFLDAGRRIEAETLRRLQGLIAQVNDAAVLQRYGHRCSEEGVLEVACISLERCARLVGDTESLLESAQFGLPRRITNDVCGSLSKFSKPTRNIWTRLYLPASQPMRSET